LSSTRIVIDTDGGVDDALALLLAFAWPETRVEDITTVHGNVPVETATRNVREVLHLAGREVNLSEGRATPLTSLFSRSSTPVFAAGVHGRDGLGGWIRTAPLRAIPPSAVSASKTIALRARQFPGEVTLVTIGPLTNAAVALREDPEGFRLLKQIVTMGGAVRERGNVTATAEFNFFADPRAAREIVHSGVPLKLVSLDATHQVVFQRDRLDRELGNRFDMRARFLRCICEQMFSFYAARLGEDIFYLHDPLAVAVALDDSLAEMQPMSIDIETRGELTRGMVVLDRRPWIQKDANVQVCVNVDAHRFLELFCERVIRAGQ
jgi:inosine-uridine nucleoside N-ribohydrolase